MSEGSGEKPVVKLTSTVDIESDGHSSFRFRKWSSKDGIGIRHLCNGQFTPREFAERLLSRQAVEPLLTEQALREWTDAELTSVGVKWWRAAEAHRPSPIMVESLETLQAAVHQRNHEHTQSMKLISAGMNALSVLAPEFNSIEHLARDLAKQNALLDLTRHSSIQEILDQGVIARSFSTITDRLAAVQFAHPDRMALASIQERIREAQVLSMPGIAELSRLAAESNPFDGLAKQAEELARQISERFRGFESIADSARASTILRSLDTSAYRGFLPDINAFQSVVSGINTSWIDRVSPEVSFAGIARMAALTAAATTSSPFDLASVTTLREALGDWRDVTMPWRFLADTNLREKFYVERGFDTNLIQLPEPAFTRALESVGLVRRQPKVAEERIEDVDAEHVLRQRMSEVYNLLFRLERALRDYVDRVMTQKFGLDWEKHRCPGNGKIYQLWVQKREKAIQTGAKRERLIQYADFTEYADLITRSDNWKEVFQDAFGRTESVRESFHRLGPVRLCTMHARPITKTELMLACAEITRLLIAIGDFEEE